LLAMLGIISSDIVACDSRAERPADSMFLMILRVRSEM
jgi:hypothetical protein